MLRLVHASRRRRSWQGRIRIGFGGSRFELPSEAKRAGEGKTINFFACGGEGGREKSEAREPSIRSIVANASNPYSCISVTSSSSSSVCPQDKTSISLDSASNQKLRGREVGRGKDSHRPARPKLVRPRAPPRSQADMNRSPTPTRQARGARFP